MPYSSYPKVAYLEPFDKNYLTNEYTTSPEYPLTTTFDTESLFEYPPTPAEMMLPSYLSKSSSFNLALPATGVSATDDQSPFQQAFYQQPFGQPDLRTSGHSIDPASTNPIDSGAFSPATLASSRTPSLCGDNQQQAVSPPLSPHYIKHESPFSSGSPEGHSAPPRPQRKRGRPRLDRYNAGSTGSSSNKCSGTGRLPHNQVERKYREGLNLELERLRKAVPTLPQNEEGAMGQPKPSKAMVLSSAIDYIKRIEQERDGLKEEVERIKQSQNQGGRGLSMNNWARRHDPLDEFLMDP